MASQVKGLSPAQLKLMSRFTSIAAQGAAAWQMARAWLAAHALLVLAGVLLLLAVLLRWWGVM